MADEDRLFHDGERALQDRFDSRRLADRLGEMAVHARFSDSDRAYIAARDMFFLATSDDEGNLDCSYKGGDPGFVRVIDESTLVFPSYDGNGMFMSLGNVLRHANVGMLFIDWETGWRMRVNGTASIAFDDPLLAEYPEAQCLVRVVASRIFPNCPRYIHRMEKAQASRYVPREGCDTPEAEWKDHFEDVLPENQQARRAARRADGGQ